MNVAILAKTRAFARFNLDLPRSSDVFWTLLRQQPHDGGNPTLLLRPLPACAPQKPRGPRLRPIGPRAKIGILGRTTKRAPSFCERIESFERDSATAGSALAPLSPSRARAGALQDDGFRPLHIPLTTVAVMRR